MKQELWIDRIGKRYVMSIELTAVLVLLLGIIGGLVVRAFGGNNAYAIVMVVGIIVSFTLEMLGHYLMYNRIKCPKCGANPARFKNGKNRSRNQVYKILKSAESCPVCNQ